MATSGIPLQTDAAAATWIWERTTPPAALPARLSVREVRRLLCSIRFSIGLIAFERAFWEKIGFLPIHRRRLLAGTNTLDGDEEYLCAKAVEMSRPTVITTATVAGHFSFGPQYAAMKSLLEERLGCPSNKSTRNGTWRHRKTEHHVSLAVADRWCGLYQRGAG